MNPIEIEKKENKNLVETVKLLERLKDLIAYELLDNGAGDSYYYSMGNIIDWDDLNNAIKLLNCLKTERINLYTIEH